MDKKAPSPTELIHTAPLHLEQLFRLQIGEESVLSAPKKDANKLVLATPSASVLAQGAIIKNAPVRRVLIDKESGNVTFNPDAKKFIYFSGSFRHQSIYAYKKMQAGINEAIAALLAGSGEQILTVRDLVKQINARQADKVLDMLDDRYESVAISVLPRFVSFLSGCAELNSRKKNKKSPEIVDVRAGGGGGFGLADNWLGLFKAVMVKLDVIRVGFDDFFETYSFRFAGGKKPSRAEFLAGRQSECSITTNNVSDTNTINNIVKYIQGIYNNKEFDTNNRALTDDYFEDATRALKTQFRDIRKKVSK